MPFQVSPGVNVSEIDLSTVVPAVSTTEGVIVGTFTQGQVEQTTLITSEEDLVARFGKPNSNNYETFLTASNFLSYGNKLYVTRVTAADAVTASASGNTTILIETRTEAEALSGQGEFVAQSAGTWGNNLKISVCFDGADFSEAITLAAGISTGATTVGCANTQLNSTVGGSNGTTNLTAGDVLRVGNSSIGFQDLTVVSTALDGDDAGVITFAPAYRLSDTSPTAATRKWAHYLNVDGAPGTSNSHIVVVDEDGGISGTANTILEVYADVSRTDGDLDDQGNSIFYKDVINERSNYIWTTAASLADGANYTSFTNGSEGTNGTESTIALSRLARGIDLYQNAEEIDISLVLAGKANTVIANYLIDNIAEVRKDCVVFISPERDDVVEQALGAELDQVLAFEAALTQSSYAVVDSGYKYQYDKYNDKFRYVPLNGDIAGLCVRTDDTRDPWYSPAGYNRGIIKNVVKLAYNPKKGERDQLYKAGVNPVITQSGQGTLLFGDKTLLAKPSAFDRINVRRLFIVLEKAIATAAKYSLFEFNDEFTRAQFRNLVEPFLRDVQGRRGIFDFRVVCDTSNNTSEVIDRNEFIGDIYVKPARSINFIQLNFVAVRTGVEFEEIVGKF
jgi:phage tail sheath protein FI